MAISRWEPFSELMPLREMMNRLMEESFFMPRTWTRTGEMMPFPVDMYETENDFVVRAAMPGMRPEDIDVRITENVLTIKGEHHEEREVGRPPMTKPAEQGRREEMAEPTYYRREISRGAFCREITMPAAIRADRAQAKFENGILMLTLPKAEEAKARRIQVTGQTGQTGQPRMQAGKQ